MATTIWVNGTALPSPVRGLEVVVSTAVDNGRNSLGELIGERVGRDQYKINNLEWRGLTRDQWSDILQLISGFVFMCKFPDPVYGGWVEVGMYCGDRTCQPYWLDDSGNFRWYESCKVNFIDRGIVDQISRS